MADQQRACLAGAVAGGALPPGSERDSSFRNRLWPGRDVPGAALPGGSLGGTQSASGPLDICDHPGLCRRLQAGLSFFPALSLDRYLPLRMGRTRCRLPASIPTATFQPIRIWRFFAISTSTPTSTGEDYAHTIYPPGAQMLFLLITRIGASVVWMKAGMVALEALTIWVLVKLLRALGLRREQVLDLCLASVASLGAGQQRSRGWRSLALYRARTAFLRPQKDNGHGDCLGCRDLDQALPHRLVPGPLSQAVPGAIGGCRPRCWAWLWRGMPAT